MPRPGEYGIQVVARAQDARVPKPSPFGHSAVLEDGPDVPRSVRDVQHYPVFAPRPDAIAIDHRRRPVGPRIHELRRKAAPSREADAARAGSLVRHHRVAAGASDAGCSLTLQRVAVVRRRAAVHLGDVGPSASPLPPLRSGGARAGHLRHAGRSMKFPHGSDERPFECATPVHGTTRRARESRRYAPEHARLGRRRLGHGRESDAYGRESTRLARENDGLATVSSRLVTVSRRLATVTRGLVTVSVPKASESDELASEPMKHTSGNARKATENDRLVTGSDSNEGRDASIFLTKSIFFPAARNRRPARECPYEGHESDALTPRGTPAPWGSPRRPSRHPRKGERVPWQRNRKARPRCPPSRSS
jgi:hypothetical protein